LSLARLRVEGQLLELGADDLRFGFEETKTFFNQCTDLKLTTDEMTSIYRRTEGWAAGMRMAALSLDQKCEGVKAVVNTTGKLRHVADYFFEEVLVKQSNDIQRFLLKTSILERMNADVCEAVTHMPDASLLLRELERENLFLVSLDREGEWFRYHHLFKEFLYQQLQMRELGQVKSLHEVAGQWFEKWL